MLTLREEQVEAFQEASFQRFVKDMSLHLCTRFPEKSALLSPQAIRECVLQGISSAESYNITDTNDIRRYLEYFFEFDGPVGQVKGTEWAAEILSANCSGTEKMNLIDNVDLFYIRRREQRS